MSEYLETYAHMYRFGDRVRIVATYTDCSARGVVQEVGEFGFSVPVLHDPPSKNMFLWWENDEVELENPLEMLSRLGAP